VRGTKGVGNIRDPKRLHEGRHRKNPADNASQARGSADPATQVDECHQRRWPADAQPPGRAV
jgi:hypothetical protein